MGLENKKDMRYEFLRSVAMLLIILLHFLSHGGVNQNLDYGNFDYIFFSIMRTLGYLGVNCFVLISGYFLYKSAFRFSKVMRIVLQTLFYSILGALIVVFFFKDNLGAKDILFSLFPVTSNKYWFVSVYVMMLFVSPLLNIVLNKMNKEQHFRAICASIMIFSVLPIVLFWSKGVLSDGKDIMWFLTLYIIAAYIRKYDVQIKNKAVIKFFLISIIGTVLLETSIKGFAQLIHIPTPEKIMFFNNQFFILSASVLLFIGARNISMNRVSNMLAKMGGFTFGVYLLHDNDLLRGHVWRIVNAPRFLDNLCVEISYMISVIILIFACGCIVEFIRQKVFNYKNIEKSFCDYIDLYINRLMAKLNI